MSRQTWVVFELWCRGAVHTLIQVITPICTASLLAPQLKHPLTLSNRSQTQDTQS